MQTQVLNIICFSLEKFFLYVKVFNFDESLVLKKGYLLKKAENLKTWRRRYFFLFNDGNLLGFEQKPQKPPSPSQSNINNKFSVRNCQIIKLDSPKEQVSRETFTIQFMAALRFFEILRKREILNK